MRLLFPLMACAALAACTVETADAPASKPAPEAQKPVATAKAPAKLSSKQAVANFRNPGLHHRGDCRCAELRRDRLCDGS